MNGLIFFRSSLYYICKYQQLPWQLKFIWLYSVRKFRLSGAFLRLMLLLEAQKQCRREEESRPNILS